MPTFKSIKALVVAHIEKTNGHVDYDALTDEVLLHFPESKWKMSHWQYWRYQLARGTSQHLLTETQKRNLYLKDPSATSTPRKPIARTTPRVEPEDKVKRIGGQLLKQVRFGLDEICGDDAKLRFKVNRWVFSRLLIDERKAKKPIKEALWNGGAQQCHDCGQAFESIKGVEIHRIDRHEIYSIENCVLLCRPCHANTKD